MTKPPAFFIVFSPEGETPPKKRHATHREAECAAWMMAEKYPEQTFYVAKVRQGTAIRWADHKEATERTENDQDA